MRRLILIIFIALILSSVSSLMLFNIDRMIYGLRVAGLNIGGISRTEAEQIIADAEQSFLNQKINLLFRDRVWTVKMKSLGVNFDPQKTIEKAYALGREKNPFLALKNQITAALGLLKIEPDFEISKPVLEELLSEKMFLIEKPAHNATLIYNKNKNDFDVEKPSEGIIINRTAVTEELGREIRELKPADIELYLIKDAPVVFQDGVRETKEKALKILAAAPFVLKFEDKKFEIGKDDLLGLFEFLPVDAAGIKILEPAISSQKLGKLLTSLAPAVNRMPINAELTVKNGRVEIFQLAQNGLELNAGKNIEPVSSAILSLQKETALIVEEKPPVINQDNIENLGIINFLGAGTSNFSGSSAARINNIRIGAFKFHGLLVEPDEEFSFTGALGSTGPGEGYLPGLVIREKKTIPEYGGGICQVSTTMFRAAINAGLKITERFPHSFPVAFYNPQGFDATVYPPHPDLRFINDTPANILIQAKIKGGALTFEIYGTKDREAKVVGLKEYDKKPDGSLKAQFTQEIYQNGKLTRSKTFYSNYKSPLLFPQEKNPLE